jgi:hypothetical protein
LDLRFEAVPTDFAFEEKALLFEPLDIPVECRVAAGRALLPFTRASFTDAEFLDVRRSSATSQFSKAH